VHRALDDIKGWDGGEAMEDVNKEVKYEMKSNERKSRERIN
jgi:hypothetical protein